MDDILIKGGSVVDGTGAPARTADVAIRDGRVTTIKENRTDSAERVIDAEGKIVTPCFIDIHTHSDFTLPLNPKADGKIRQGVTTEIIGNCGFSVAPALPEKVEELRAYLFGSALDACCPSRWRWEWRTARRATASCSIRRRCSKKD